MLIYEAVILQSVVSRIKPSRILDCGSGEQADRTIIQPHIAAAFTGYDVVWTNKHSENGTEVVCDFTKPETLVGLPRCELVTSCSLLEHVENIDNAIKSIASLVDRWLIVTVPLSYPIHNCPIDNGWRPEPAELGERIAAMGFTVIQELATEPERFGEVENAQQSMVVMKRN